MTTVTISLPESLKAFVETQVETRGYGNVSEYFRTLLREAQEREAEKRLEELLLESLESGGEDIEVTPEFWRALKIDVAQQIEERKKERRRA